MCMSVEGTVIYVQKIAREKAGIFKTGVPAFTVQQPADALETLQV